MTTFYVLSEPCSNDDELIVTSIFNPKQGQVIAEFQVPEPSAEFNPITYLTDGRIEESQRLHDETRAKAEKFLADWQAENAIATHTTLEDRKMNYVHVYRQSGDINNTLKIDPTGGENIAAYGSADRAAYDSVEQGDWQWNDDFSCVEDKVTGKRYWI